MELYVTELTIYFKFNTRMSICFFPYLITAEPFNSFSIFNVSFIENQIIFIIILLKKNLFW